MQTEIVKWGNSLALRIPAKMARENGFVLGAIADMQIEEGKLVITPRQTHSRAQRLERMIASLETVGQAEEILAGEEVGAETVSW